MPNPEQYIPEEARGEKEDQERASGPTEEQKSAERPEEPLDVDTQLRQEGWEPFYPNGFSKKTLGASFTHTRDMNSLRREGNEVRVEPFYDDEGRLVKHRLQIWTRRLEKKDEPEMGG